MYFLNTAVNETMEELKWDSETDFIAWIFESAEYFNPNFPFINVFTSYLLLFIILHNIIYLKQLTALGSCIALN